MNPIDSFTLLYQIDDRCCVGLKIYTESIMGRVFAFVFRPMLGF
jgi:hypothetical protein